MVGHWLRVGHRGSGSGTRCPIKHLLNSIKVSDAGACASSCTCICIRTHCSLRNSRPAVLLLVLADSIGSIMMQPWITGSTWPELLVKTPSRTRKRQHPADCARFQFLPCSLHCQYAAASSRKSVWHLPASQAVGCRAPRRRWPPAATPKRCAQAQGPAALGGRGSTHVAVSSHLTTASFRRSRAPAPRRRLPCSENRACGHEAPSCCPVAAAAAQC